MAPTHVAFLRAVNLGGNRKASGEQLRAAFESAGFDEVATFRNSGNVVFRGSGRASELTARIEKGLRAQLGFETTVFLRTAARLRAISEREPFPASAVATSKGKLQVALLAAKPSAKARRETLALSSEQDLLELEGTELYWLPAKGTQKSALGMAGIDRALGPATVRTMGTIEQLAAKYF